MTLKEHEGEYRYSCHSCEKMSIWWQCTKANIEAVMARHARRKHPKDQITSISLYRGRNNDLIQLATYRFEKD